MFQPRRPQTRHNELLAQICAGTRGFEVEDRDEPNAVRAFQHDVRELDALVAAGLITIGAREVVSDGSGLVVAVRRIRLTEAGKRRASAGQSRPDGPD